MISNVPNVPRTIHIKPYSVPLLTFLSYKDISSYQSLKATSSLSVSQSRTDRSWDSLDGLKDEWESIT